VIFLIINAHKPTQNRTFEAKACDIIAFAAAEMRDVAEGFGSRPCPILTSLATAHPKKAEPCLDVD